MDTIRERLLRLEALIKPDVGDEDNIALRLRKLEARVESILSADEAVSAAVKEAEKLISAGLLPADAFVYESPEAAEAYVASGKAISHEREGAELELLTASKRIDDFISGLQTHQRLSQTALNTQQIREEQRCKPELSAITDQFTRLCEDVSNLSNNTTTLLEAYSHLVDYITAQTVLLDKEIPKT